jgi:hypothetical protein
MLSAGTFATSRNIPQYLARRGQSAAATGAQKILSGKMIESPVKKAGLMGADALRSGSAISEDVEQDKGRSPQSIMDAPKVNFMLQDTELKRDTEWIKKHPNLTVGKLMQSAPELAAQVQIALEKGNDSVLKKTLPLIAQQVPELFEFDEFGIFDGKIIDPNMKQLYTDKVMSDNSLDTYQKTQIINHLNKTNEVLA